MRNPFRAQQWAERVARSEEMFDYIFRNHTQKHIAATINVSRALIGRWASKRDVPTMAMLDRLEVLYTPDSRKESP